MGISLGAQRRRPNLERMEEIFCSRLPVLPPAEKVEFPVRDLDNNQVCPRERCSGVWAVNLSITEEQYRRLFRRCAASWNSAEPSA